MTILEPPNQSDYAFNEMPDWLKKLKDQYVKVGEGLIYEFGENRSFFGGKTDVKVELRRAFMFSSYDAYFNSFVVNRDKLTNEDVGLYKIVVEVSYNDPKGRK